MSPPALEVALCDAQHIGSLDVDERDSKCATCASSTGASSTCASSTCASSTGASSTGASTADVITQTGSSSQVERVKSDIPRALRRKVKHRDHSKCRVPWCRSSINIDCHHIKHVAHGGTHSYENVICLCESHHLAHHAGGLVIEGSASNLTIRRHAHNALSTVERVVDTARALKDLGFDKDEVTTAMDKTRTHVGTAELTLEQWIKIALGYCPRPK